MEWLPANAMIILAGGGLIGFLLGLLGGGGSLLAVPFLLQVGGITSPHLAIGTSAVAVALNAYINALSYARHGHVAWRPALLFAGVGSLTAILGAMLGLNTPSYWLMVAFGGLTMGVAIWMWFKKSPATPPATSSSTSKTLLAGLGVGGLAGFFGIGGGFLMVPALLWATGLEIRKVMGTSLIGVGTLGLGTALTYAWAGQIDWAIAGLLLVSGVGGGQLGHLLGGYLHDKNKALLQKLFAGFIFMVGAWMILRHTLAL
jgi:uncharacterized membrane protein YfcA